MSGLGDSDDRALALVNAWLGPRLGEVSRTWLDEKSAQLEDDAATFLAFALAPRKVGKADLTLSDEELRAAEALHPGWRPRGWSVDQLARLSLLLKGPRERFLPRFDKLCATGDVRESVALYQALPLYPDPESLVARAAEGLRTNIVPVFEAVAHGNPFPRDHFDEAAWNQMVLKAIFVGTALHPIMGIDERANETLARTLIDYAHERWAASRQVSPELWRGVGPFLNAERLPDIERAWASEDPMAHEAAGLALAASPPDLPDARKLLLTDSNLAKGIDSGEVSWSLVHRTLWIDDPA